MSYKSKWLEETNKKLGRSLRVLHVGNIANNAYNNAKLLRQSGIEVDVLCYDYYHIMGCPEWEELAIKHDYKDDFFPIFHWKDLWGYKRPDWFIQGPFPLCFLYIQSKFKKKIFPKAILKMLMKLSRRSTFMQGIGTLIGYVILRRRDLRDILGRKVRLILASVGVGTWKVLNNAQSIHAAYLSSIVSNKNIVELETKKWFESLIFSFEENFPDRMDKLKYEETLPYFFIASMWKEIFSNYDIIQCYGTDPIVALMGQAKPYVAYEHGTLRHFTLEDNSVSRLNALGYRKADHVFITNGDCLEYAQKLGITRYSPMVHPIIIEKPTKEKKIINKIRKSYNADVLLFCPIRHDWAIKGTDIYLRALPKIRERINGKVILLLVHWGMEVENSCRLIEELNCKENVRWLKPLSRKKLIEFMVASDIILDQMALPVFGGTAPQAMTVGTPVIMNYRPEVTSWIVDKPAPILAAFTVEDVIEAIVKGLDPAWREEYKIKAWDWMKTHHSTDRIISEHFRVYKQIMNTPC